MYKKIILKNNIPVVMETTGDVRSVCIGIWVKAGARNEAVEKNGISHFLEHMFFKGTGSLTSKEIATEIDSIGGELNAFTSCEYTALYVKVLDEYLGKALELLTDIFLNSTFPDAEIEKEKGVITEEINMVEDNPSDYIHELFSKSIWGDAGPGLPVLGKREVVQSFKRDDILKHIEEYYGRENIIIACSGNLKADGLIENLNAGLGGLKQSVKKKSLKPTEFRSSLNIIPKDLSETHICMGLEGIPYGSDDRYSMYLLNTILGAGFSSRLFQEVREKRGLAYSVYSFNLPYTDTALWAVYAGTEKKHVREVVDIIGSEIRGLPDTISEEELRRAKSQLKGNLILALESTSTKMTNLAKQEIYYGRYFTPEEIIKDVDAVSLEKLRGLAGRLSRDKSFALTIYGNVREEDINNLGNLRQ
jgi:predicted Zn-dependent peptidase